MRLRARSRAGALAASSAMHLRPPARPPLPESTVGDACTAVSFAVVRPGKLALAPRRVVASWGDGGLMSEDDIAAWLREVDAGGALSPERVSRTLLGECC